MSESTETAKYSFSKKRPKSLRNTSTISSTTDSPSASSTSELVTAPKKYIANPLIQGTSTRRKLDASAQLSLLLSDEEDSAPAADSFKVRYSASSTRQRRRSSSPPAEMSAETIKDSKRDKNTVEEERKEDGMYHGEKGQAHKLPKAFGPVKGGPGNVRTITLVDYQPDVCKDYKETGFCGFGDTCKFLHDRGDYLHGWQLDNSFLSSSAAAGSFLAKQASRTNAGTAQDADSDSDNEDLPFACLICRKPFGNEPVVTLCGHYFDSKCAVERFRKTGKCFACGKGTNGVFNKATKLIAQVKERERLEAAAALEEKEFEEDDDDGDGVEIEGLVDVTEKDKGKRARVDREEEGDEEEEEEEEQPKRVRRRPIIEIQ